MPNGESGARAAFAGYLYQITGALGLIARVSPDVQAAGNELDALVEVTRTGELHHERLGQDLVLATLGIDQADNLVLVQFKYSQQHPTPVISPGELRAIIDRLLGSRALATQQGAQVTGFALVTNRRLGPGAQELVDAARAGAVATQVDDDPRWEVFRTIRVITELQQVDWEADVDRFARSFGALDDEISQGRNALIGDLMHRAANGPDTAVRKEDLVQAFTGYRDTKPLTWSSLRAEVVRKIADFLVHSPGEPLRRQLQDEIRQAASASALVVVYGYGGCGKTVGLKQWAIDVTESADPQQGSFGVVQVARGLPDPWLAKLVSEWQQVPADNPRRHDLNDVSLRRLRQANQDGPQPLLCLALDGVDEELGPAEEFVRDTINWFWGENARAQKEERPPEATLVVSVRDAAEIDQNWLARNPSGFEYVGEGPPKVHVGDFSFEELRDAAVAVPAIAERIAATIAVLTVDQGVQTAQPVVLPAALPVLGVEPPANASVVLALRHPVMWASLLQLEANQQVAALDADPAALRLLARRFICRFHNKVNARGQVVELTIEQLIDVLRSVAQQTHQLGGEVYLLNQWDDAVTPTGLLNRSDARALF